MDKTVKYYMAPLESVTTWIYRQAHAKIYGRLDKYFIPFLEPHEKRDFKTRELQEILPEHMRTSMQCSDPDEQVRGIYKVCKGTERLGI